MKPRKRSPDTVGILLAGSADDGLEALVGDEEVFQIVRGNVTSDSLLKLVDNATQPDAPDGPGRIGQRHGS